MKKYLSFLLVFFVINNGCSAQDEAQIFIYEEGIISTPSSLLNKALINNSIQIQQLKQNNQPDSILNSSFSDDVTVKSDTNLVIEKTYKLPGLKLIYSNYSGNYELIVIELTHHTSFTIGGKIFLAGMTRDETLKKFPSELENVGDNIFVNIAIDKNNILQRKDNGKILYSDVDRIEFVFADNELKKIIYRKNLL